MTRWRSKVEDKGSVWHWLLRENLPTPRAIPLIRLLTPNVIPSYPRLLLSRSWIHAGSYSLDCRSPLDFSDSGNSRVGFEKNRNSESGEIGRELSWTRDEEAGIQALPSVLPSRVRGMFWVQFNLHNRNRELGEEGRSRRGEEKEAGSGWLSLARGPRELQPLQDVLHNEVTRRFVGEETLHGLRNSYGTSSVDWK